jgi:hypothetical protein
MTPVQGGVYIPIAVFNATGDQSAITSCQIVVSVNLCSFPSPHGNAVDVSEFIPTGRSTVQVDILDWGGSFGHTELYLLIVPRPLWN